MLIEFDHLMRYIFGQWRIEKLDFHLLNHFAAQLKIINFSKFAPRKLSEDHVEKNVKKAFNVVSSGLVNFLKRVYRGE